MVSYLEEFMEYGIFTGAGVGPGDPELITYKALKAIERSDVLMLPSKDKAGCRAYNIVAAACREAGIHIDDKRCMFRPFPMKMNRKELAVFHSETANEVAALLREGLNVTFLTIGDPCIYSTYDYVAELISAMGFTTQWINGVTSFCAAAARLGVSLGRGSDEVHIIPGSADINEALLLSGTRVFMKSSSGLKELKDRLAELEAEGRISVTGVCECGLENEKIIAQASDIPGEKGYMSVIIVRDNTRPEKT